MACCFCLSVGASSLYVKVYVVLGEGVGEFEGLLYGVYEGWGCEVLLYGLFVDGYGAFAWVEAYTGCGCFSTSCGLYGGFHGFMRFGG